MDAELALITANIALAGPGKLFYDPFCGTGSFPIAVAEFGAVALGSDIDGRSIRGDGGEKTLRGNFEQYGLLGRLGGTFTADLTNSPIRKQELGSDGDGVRGRVFDGIVCDPPYGVREGLMVLGVRDPEKTPWVERKGREMYKYVHSAHNGVVKNGERLTRERTDKRISSRRGNHMGFWRCWMTSSNLRLRRLSTMAEWHSGCRLRTTKNRRCLCRVILTWKHSQFLPKCSTNVCLFPLINLPMLTPPPGSRRLICYRRIPDKDVDSAAVKAREERKLVGKTADELNPFRKAYFEGFQTPPATTGTSTPAAPATETPPPN